MCIAPRYLHGVDAYEVCAAPSYPLTSYYEVELDEWRSYVIYSPPRNAHTFFGKVPKETVLRLGASARATSALVLHRHRGNFVRKTCSPITCLRTCVPLLLDPGGKRKPNDAALHRENDDVPPAT